MAASKKATQKTGVTHFPLEEEKKNQKRVPPRGKTKEEMKTTSQSRDKRGARSPALTAVEERTISRQGAKGGKSSGSRAGLVSSSKKTRRT
jgi:hypothetical protein